MTTAYKTFNHDFTCQGFQYEVGKTYRHEGKVVACPTSDDLKDGAGGFHACLAPLDCWLFYDPIDNNLNFTRYAEVKQAGEKAGEKADTKIASAEITIKAELSLPEFIQAGVDWLIAHATGESDNPSGDYARIGVSGHSASIGASGYSARIGVSGYSASIGASGYSASIGASGAYARIGASGYSASIGASGAYARIGASGASARIGASGDSARIGASGHSARIGASGAYARIGASGGSARIGASGENSVIASAGQDTRAKGAGGTWISLAEFNADGKCIGFATGRIGEEGLKPDVFYLARGGRLEEETPE